MIVGCVVEDCEEVCTSDVNEGSIDKVVTVDDDVLSTAAADDVESIVLKLLTWELVVDAAAVLGTGLDDVLTGTL